MKISIRKRPIILISLILIPMLLMISSFNLNAQAGPDIPEPDPENGWHWDVDVGTEIYFEGEFILTNSSTGEVYSMWRDIWIYNITSIENVTIDWLGMHEFSQVNATQCYYNVTEGELEPYNDGYSSELALFGYDTIDSTYRIRAGQNGMPFLLPINGSSGIDVDFLDDVINETFYSPMGNVVFNAFDNYTNNGLNRIYFSNSTDGFFSDGYYYDNGTMAYGEAYLAAYMEDDPIYINATMKQVTNYDITDEITWGVSPGQDIYYDWYEGSDPVGEAYDVKVHVTSISPVLLNKTRNSFSGEDDDPVFMVYESVFGDIYTWNGIDYELEEVDIPIGIANNFYPQYFDEDGPNLFNFLYPNNFVLEDFEFMWNNDTLRIWNAPFDEIYYSENGIFESLVVNSTGTDVVKSEVDKSTGIVQSYLMTQGSYTMFYEIKAQTLVDWSVNPDDILYYKNNEEEFREVKATILGTMSYYANLSAILTPIGLPIPSGQPELQFYSVVYAEIEEWDPVTETWVFEDTTALAVSNIYWPISPLQFDFGPPILMPENTASSDLSDLFDIYGSIYDEITYTTGHVLLRNNTLDRELNFYFDEASGRVTMMYGWIKQPFGMSEWSYISIYPKFYQALPPGLNLVAMNTDLDIGMTISLNINVAVGGPGAEFIYNFLPFNPTNVTLPVGTELAFFDQLFVNYGLITGNITMTITLPLSIDLSVIAVHFFAFNMSGTETWDEAPPDFYSTIIYNYETNSFTLETPAWGPLGVISAMSYEYVDTPGHFTLTSTADDPDDDGDFDLTWTASSGALTYTIYQYDSYITEINGSLTLIAAGVTDLTNSLSSYTNGTYYFIVVANNSYGETLSNCIQIVVEIPPSEAGEPEIPGYNLFFLSLMLIIVSGLVIRKVRRK